MPCDSETKAPPPTSHTAGTLLEPARGHACPFTLLSGCAHLHQHAGLEPRQTGPQTSTHRAPLHLCAQTGARPTAHGPEQRPLQPARPLPGPSQTLSPEQCPPAPRSRGLWLAPGHRTQGRTSIQSRAHRVPDLQTRMEGCAATSPSPEICEVSPKLDTLPLTLTRPIRPASLVTLTRPPLQPDAQGTCRERRTRDTRLPLSAVSGREGLRTNACPSPSAPRGSSTCPCALRTQLPGVGETK